MQGPLRRLDLVVPATTPVAELLPELVALGVGGTDGGPGRVSPWRLSRALGPDLEPDRTLREAGVRDGDLLLLRHETAPPLGVLRSDPVVVLSASVDRAPGRWTAERRTSLAIALLVPALLGLLVAGDRVTSHGVTALLAVLAALVLLAAAVASRAEGRTAVALAALSVLPGAAAGWAVAGSLDVSRPAGLAWASGTALAVCLAGSRCALAARRPLLGLGTGLLAALLLSALALTGAGPVRVSAVGLVVTVAAVPLVPAYALRVAGVVRTGGGTGPADETAARRAQGARAVVTWVVGALAPLVAVLAGVVAGDGGLCGRWLAGVAGLTLVLRARSALFTAEVVGLALAGAAAVVCAATGWVLAALSTGSAAAALLPLAGLCLLALLLALPSTRTAVAAPATDRRLRQLEAAGLLALVPLVLGVLGVFGAVADAASGLR